MVFVPSLLKTTNWRNRSSALLANFMDGYSVLHLFTPLWPITFIAI